MTALSSSNVGTTKSNEGWSQPTLAVNYHRNEPLSLEYHSCDCLSPFFRDARVRLCL